MDTISKGKKFEEIFYQRFDDVKLKAKELKKEKIFTYVQNLESQVNGLIEGLSKQNFWRDFPKILGIDAKMRIFFDMLNISNERTSFDNEFIISEEELINIVEEDYRIITKEEFGYKLKEENLNSLIFFLE